MHLDNSAVLRNLYDERQAAAATPDHSGSVFGLLIAVLLRVRLGVLLRRSIRTSTALPVEVLL